jgi:NADH dehydrogenase [ubiquinone] 1 alpha subcomplex assembly factor 3
MLQRITHLSFKNLSGRTGVSALSFLPQTDCLYRSRLLAGNRRTFSSFGKGVDVLEDEDSGKCYVKKYNPHAFEINNVYVRSSVILFQNSFLQWKVRSVEEFKPEDLSIFSLLYPLLDIVIVGTGENMIMDREKMEAIRQYLKSHGIACEIMKTVDAAPTFNFLNSEGRHVAAALLTVEPVPLEEKNPTEETTEESTDNSQEKEKVDGTSSEELKQQQQQQQQQQPSEKNSKSDSEKRK